MEVDYRLNKLLLIKENEKDKVIGEYNDAVQTFEEVGNNLYKLLKQKEEIEAQYDLQMQYGLDVQRLQQLKRYLLQLEKSIKDKQHEVAKARQHMNVKEKLLLDKNIEVKKYEKMKEKAQVAFYQYEKSVETKLMDEISIQQYMNRGN